MGQVIKQHNDKSVSITFGEKLLGCSTLMNSDDEVVLTVHEYKWPLQGHLRDEEEKQDLKDDGVPPVYFRFKNREGLEVLIGWLESLRLKFPVELNWPVNPFLDALVAQMQQEELLDWQRAKPRRKTARKKSSKKTKAKKTVAKKKRGKK